MSDAAQRLKACTERVEHAEHVGANAARVAVADCRASPQVRRDEACLIALRYSIMMSRPTPPPGHLSQVSVAYVVLNRWNLTTELAAGMSRSATATAPSYARAVGLGFRGARDVPCPLGDCVRSRNA
jgi:hypothetical protein